MTIEDLQEIGAAAKIIGNPMDTIKLLVVELYAAKLEIADLKSKLSEKKGECNVPTPVNQ